MPGSGCRRASGRLLTRHRTAAAARPRSASWCPPTNARRICRAARLPAQQTCPRLRGDPAWIRAPSAVESTGSLHRLPRHRLRALRGEGHEPGTKSWARGSRASRLLAFTDD
jgi:hypothetical protein